MLSNDQPLGRAGFEAVGSLGLIDPSNDPLNLKGSSAPSAVCLNDMVDVSTPRPSVEDVLSWADQLLDAVHQLHTQPKPVVHGAITPSSIFLDGKTVKLLPASELDETDANVSFKPLEQMWESLDHVTQRVILNPMDEKAQNSLLKDPSPASDIYSIGATMYAIATGIIPSDALDRTIAEMEGKPDPLVHPSELSSALPTEIGDAIVKAMSLRREDRPFSAVILRQVFRTATVKIQERLANEPAVEPTARVEAPEIKTTQTEDADADHARQLAFKILAEKTAPVQNDEEILDLGIPDSPVQQQVDDSVPVTLDVSPTDVIYDEPVETPVQDLLVASAEVESHADLTPSFMEGVLGEEQPRSSSKGMAIGVAAAAVVIAAIAGFFVFSSKSSAPPAVTPVVTSEAPAPPPTALADAPAQTQPEPEQVAGQTVPASETTDTSSHERNTRGAITPPAQDKTKKNAKPAPAKKQVTVDDLINDN